MLLMTSQSVQINSNSTWFPVIVGNTFSNAQLQSSEWICSQEHFRNITNVVSNLTAPQITEIYNHTNPNYFFPHVGIFLSDFAVSTVLFQNTKR